MKLDLVDSFNVFRPSDEIGSSVVFEAPVVVSSGRTLSSRTKQVSVSSLLSRFEMFACTNYDFILYFVHNLEWNSLMFIIKKAYHYYAYEYFHRVPLVRLGTPVSSSCPSIINLICRKLTSQCFNLLTFTVKHVL